MRKYFTLFALLLVFAIPAAMAQATLSNTTLSAAVTTTSNQMVVIASATGVTAGQTMLFVDKEAMFVNALSGTTATVVRG
jgi:hypothetical protein